MYRENGKKLYSKGSKPFACKICHKKKAMAWENLEKP
jgi:hypothetical protein